MPANREDRRLSVAWTGTILIVLTIGMIAIGLADLGAKAQEPHGVHSGWNWIGVLVLMIAFVIVLGVGLNGRVWGVLINERMRMSLSRFHMLSN